MKSRSITLAAFLLLATLSACLPQRPMIVNAYSGPERPAAQLANVSCVSLEVKAINGSPVSGDGKTKYSDQGTGTCGVMLLPGIHEIRLAYAHFGSQGATSGVFRSKRDKSIKIKLAAGREYTLWGLESDVPADDGWKITVVDDTKTPNADPNAPVITVPYTLIKQ